MVTLVLSSCPSQWRKRKTFEGALLHLAFLVYLCIAGTGGEENGPPETPNEVPPPADAPAPGQPPFAPHHYDPFPTPSPFSYMTYGENPNTFPPYPSPSPFPYPRNPENFPGDGYQDPYQPRGFNGRRNYRPPRYEYRPNYSDQYSGNGSDSFPRQPYQYRGRRPFNRYEGDNFNASFSSKRYDRQNDTHNVNVEGDRKHRQQTHEKEKKSKIGKVFRFVKSIFGFGDKKKKADDDLKPEGDERKPADKNDKGKGDDFPEDDGDRKGWNRYDRKFPRPRNFQDRNFNRPNFRNYQNNPEQGYQPRYRNYHGGPGGPPHDNQGGPGGPPENHRYPSANQNYHRNPNFNADPNAGDQRNNKQFNYKPYHENYNHPNNPDNKPKDKQDDGPTIQGAVINPWGENSNTRSMDSNTWSSSVNSNTRSPDSDTKSTN